MGWNSVNSYIHYLDYLYPQLPYFITPNISQRVLNVAFTVLFKPPLPQSRGAYIGLTPRRELDTPQISDPRKHPADVAGSS